MQFLAAYIGYTRVAPHYHGFFVVSSTSGSTVGTGGDGHDSGEGGDSEGEKVGEKKEAIGILRTFAILIMVEIGQNISPCSTKQIHDFEYPTFFS